MSIVMVLGGILALAAGLYFGWAGEYRQPAEDIERRLGRKGGRSGRARRHFTPLDLLRKEERGSKRRQTRRPFRMAASRRPESADRSDD